ncbi:hypothetical protein NSPZN2_60081 [Nitrospira defluvii]|uniref:Uncharacterized protein n=1 Tax=Nitrospira defluvii TaxID=330214 RepID=A0ABM8S6Z9_9BACT|nr:hypothetical protein NSPZN2_60081 [Nitrospira defluvii]
MRGIAGLVHCAHVEPYGEMASISDPVRAGGAAGIMAVGLVLRIFFLPALRLLHSSSRTR